MIIILLKDLSSKHLMIFFAKRNRGIKVANNEPIYFSLIIQIAHKVFFKPTFKILSIKKGNKNRGRLN